MKLYRIPSYQIIDSLIFSPHLLLHYSMKINLLRNCEEKKRMLTKWRNLEMVKHSTRKWIVFFLFQPIWWSHSLWNSLLHNSRARIQRKNSFCCRMVFNMKLSDLIWRKVGYQIRWSSYLVTVHSNQYFTWMSKNFSCLSTDISSLFIERTCYIHRDDCPWLLENILDIF